ncbi:MarR family winged helix-turn-helix transcriptional regulator [Streptomyces sp. NPDC048650]|uniref:MarR family winged helix-turn-helix transcriptional regulator n=1 Tax=Streptomyces sp. NPDC048650 TaxID=3365583 RepID=UPI0037109ADF
MSLPPSPLSLEVIDLICTMVVRYNEEYEAAAAGHRLTGVQARLVALLTHGPLPMRRIAEQLKCEPSNVTGLVDRLEARGLVQRRPDPADRRVKLVVVTDAGRTTAGLLRGALDFAREPLAALPAKDRETLRDLLRTILT